MFKNISAMLREEFEIFSDPFESVSDKREPAEVDIAVPMVKEVPGDKPEPEKFKGPHAHLSTEKLNELISWVDNASRATDIPNEARAELLDYHARLQKELNERGGDVISENTDSDYSDPNFVGNLAQHYAGKSGSYSALLEGLLSSAMITIQYNSLSILRDSVDLTIRQLKENNLEISNTVLQRYSEINHE